MIIQTNSLVQVLKQISKSSSLLEPSLPSCVGAVRDVDRSVVVGEVQEHQTDIVLQRVFFVFSDSMRRGMKENRVLVVLLAERSIYKHWFEGLPDRDLTL